MAYSNYPLTNVIATCENSNQTYWTTPPGTSWANWANSYAQYLTSDNPIASSEFMTTHWVFGDETLGIRINYTSDYSVTMSFHRNNQQCFIISSIEPGRSGLAHQFYVGVDEENQQAFCFMMAYYTNSGGNNCRRLPYAESLNTYRTDLYYIFKAAGITYTWISVPAISGKNGILSLPTLFSQPTDGNPVTDADMSAFFKWNMNAEISALSGGKILNEETLIVVSGDDFRCTATWNSTTSVTIKFYMPEQTTPFASTTYVLSHASDEIFFAMLEWDFTQEEQHEWARPSFIIHDGVTGKYSYNTENVSDSFFEDYYAWISASIGGGYTIWGDENDAEGGNGYGIPTDEPIPEPALPTISSLNLNMTKMYKCSKEQINAFWDWLNDPDTQIENNLFGNDPLQAIVGLNICPVEISADGNPEIVFLGNHTGVFAPRVTDQFQDIDCGTITLDSYMHGSYLDFAPYTSIKCIVPYVGAIQLDPDDVMPSVDPNTGKYKKKKLQLKLRLDVLTGVCVAHIYVNNSLHYEAGGQINIPVPMTQKDYTEVGNAVRRAISNVAQSIAQSAVIGAMTGGMAGAGVGIGGSLISSGMDIALSKPKYTYVQAGAGASSSFLGIDRPYLLIEIPKLARPANDEKYFGMPSYITGKVKDFVGYGKFKNPHMDTLTCTEREKEEIVSLMSNGIINQVGTSAESSTPSDEPTTSGNTVITFLKNKSDRNVMGKTFSATTLKVEGKLLYDNSITTPVFLINGDITGYNYAYIGLFSRFYYISDVVIKNNGMCEVHMNSDPLQSFKSDIKEREAICERSQDINKNNFYINDGAMIIKQDSYVFTKQFEKSNAHFSFNKGNASYTLILADA